MCGAALEVKGPSWSLIQVFTPDRIVVAFGIGFHFEVGEILVGGLLELIMLVNYRRVRIQAGRRSKDEA